jgi:hypothetical protein
VGAAVAIEAHACQRQIKHQRIVFSLARNYLQRAIGTSRPLVNWPPAQLRHMNLHASLSAAARTTLAHILRDQKWKWRYKSGFGRDQNQLRLRDSAKRLAGDYFLFFSAPAAECRSLKCTSESVRPLGPDRKLNGRETTGDGDLARNLGPIAPRDQGREQDLRFCSLPKVSLTF